MEKESIREALEEKKRRYYSLRYKLEGIKSELLHLKKHRGHTPAFKQLLISIDMMQDQVQSDFNRYEKGVKRIEERREIKSLQNSLSREQKKRLELETKIKEATESSGLFIRYVREKLGLSG